MMSPGAMGLANPGDSGDKQGNLHNLVLHTERIRTTPQQALGHTQVPARKNSLYFY